LSSLVQHIPLDTAYSGRVSKDLPLAVANLLLLRGRMLIHPEVVAVLEQTFLLGPPVDQLVRFGGAAVGPLRPGTVLSRLGQDLEREQ
jgi:hypothetical protein